jgi:hypothetical protein
MLRYVIILGVVGMAVGTFSAPVVQAAPGAKMSTVQAIDACRAELGKHAKYLDVRACVVRKMKGE